ncbi:m106 protein [Murid betaherpesvirus 1]|uniref:M106 n=3 Tax=Murid herpesvirus 1 TaxID=10366 RepID=B3UX52_MUHV1|nr:m106 [Muromegalovirus G4]ACE95446.1 m106 [Muromegalovirus WP15B]QNL29248.1 m106 [Muromegalovirus G4]UNW45329.1 m106 protein [Murid betaherpesvirus 1]CCE56610.1 m106 protein [Murid betaherpesvirus 1]
MATASQQQPPPPPPGAIVPCGHTIPMLRGGGHIELCAIQGHGCLHPPLPLDDNVAAAANTTETTTITTATATAQTSRRLRGNARIRLNPRPIPRPPAGPHEHHRRRRDQRRSTQQISFMPLQSNDQQLSTNTIPEIPRIVVEVVD